MYPLHKPSAFTLIELLIVIAIIAVLAALAVPTVTGGLAKASAAGCLSNLRQIGTATLAYAAENNFSFPNAGSGGTPEWAMAIEPYVGQAKDKRSIFACPGCEVPVQSASGNEIAVTYGMHGGLMPKGGQPKKKLDVKRPAEIILCADMCQNPGNKGWSPYSIENPPVFTAPGGGRGGSGAIESPIAVSTDADRENSAWMRYRHAGSVNAVMCDGSAQSIKKGEVLNRNANWTQ